MVEEYVNPVCHHLYCSGCQSLKHYPLSTKQAWIKFQPFLKGTQTYSQRKNVFSVRLFLGGIFYGSRIFSSASPHHLQTENFIQVISAVRAGICQEQMMRPSHVDL